MLIGAIDIGGTKTIVGVTDEKGNIVEYVKIKTTDYPAHFENCASLLQRLCSNAGISAMELKGVGINLPGMVDIDKGLLIRAPFGKWENIDVYSFFSTRLGNQRVFIENDVNACAIGEMYFGHKDRYKDYIWITISTGVGGALVSGSKLIRGFQGVAGEIGHVKVEYEKPQKCPCGQWGCLEAHGSGTAITNAVKEQVDASLSFKAAFAQRGLAADAEGCAALVKEGVKEAEEIYANAADYLARGISYAINLLNPEAVILGGGVASSLDIMLPKINSSISKYVVAQAHKVDVIYTRLGYDAAFLGAAALVLNNYN